MILVMLDRMLGSPYRYVPLKITKGRIDGLIAQRAVAEVQSSGRRGPGAVDLVTFKVNGAIVDQFQVHGHTAQTIKFVTEFNKAVRQAD